MGGSERARLWLAMALAAPVIGLAACGDDDDSEGGTPAGGDPILIKTQLDPVSASGQTMGQVRSGSTIGDSTFCRGGNFLDGPVKPPHRSVMRDFRCPGGILTITFVSTPPGVKQRSDWKVVRGLGRFEGLRGGGRMTAVDETGSGEPRETFTGTVTR
jgi:hypothetical protein